MIMRTVTGVDTGAGAEPPAQAPRRLTKRRIQTRQRLLDAALAVFAEEGFGRSTVEQVCERAGYTRGAFYSNFVSLEELFLAIWEQRSARLPADFRASVATASPPTENMTLADATAHMLAAIPVDDQWYRITAEFSAHAMRNPALKSVLAAREKAIIVAIMPVIEAALSRIGRRVIDSTALGRALVAVHDGTTIQVLLEPDDEHAKQSRARLFVCVLENYSERAES